MKNCRDALRLILDYQDNDKTKATNDATARPTPDIASGV